MDRWSIMGETVTHFHFPIRAALAVDDATLHAFLGAWGETRPAEEVRTDLVILLAKGYEVAPLGGPRCSHFDPVMGCLGHAREEAAAEARAQASTARAA